MIEIDVLYLACVRWCRGVSAQFCSVSLRGPKTKGDHNAAKAWIWFFLSDVAAREKKGGNEGVMMCWKVTEVDLVISPCRSDIINPYLLV